MAVAHGGFAPAGFQTVVAVLQPESALVNGLHHLLRRATRPTTEFAWGLWNVACSVGTKVVDNHVRILVARPNVARLTRIDAVDAVGVVTEVAHVAAKDFRTQLEPTLRLPAQSGDGAGIEVWIHVGIGVFVFDLFAYKNGQLIGVLSDKARKHHVGEVVVADHIGIAVVGDATAQGMRNCFGGDVLAHVGTVVTEQAHCYRGNLPCVVGIVEPSLHLLSAVGGHFVKAENLGDDALALAIVPQLVGIFCPSVVVGRDDHILGTFFTAALPFLHTGGIVDDGQLVIIHQFGGEDGVPIRRAQAVFAKMPIATFKVHRKFNVGEHFQFLGDRIVLERRNGYRNSLNATDIRTSHDKRLGGIERIFAVDVHVFHIVHVRLLVLRLDTECRGDVDIVEDFGLKTHHIERSCGPLRDGHHAALGGEVGVTGIIGDGDGRNADFRHFLATIVELAQRHLSKIVGDVQPVAGLFR